MKRNLTYLCILGMVLSLTGCSSGRSSRKTEAKAADAASAQIPDYAKKKKAVRLMTYNVGVFGKYMENSIPLVADLLKEAQPDIVGFNELDSCNTRHNVYQLQELDTCLGEGWDFVFQSMFPYAEGGYGVGIETTHKILGSRSYDIPKTPGVRHMGLLAVETEKFVFLSTHLNTSPAVSLEQAKLINEYVKKDYWNCGKPVFLAGDMNSYPDSETIAELGKCWTVISTLDPTFPSKGPKKCIDYILALNNGQKCKVIKSAVGTGFKSGDVSVASDHLPVFVDVILP